MELDAKIQEWFRTYQPGTDMAYTKEWWKNNLLIRDRLLELFRHAEAEIVGTHYSKSVLCPVIKTVYKEVEIIWQYNFYDWQIMVNSKKEIKLSSLNLYKADGDYFYYQGIPEEYQFKPYSKTNRHQFAIDIYGEQLDVWAFAVELRKAIDR